MINIIYPCPISFCPLDSFCPSPPTPGSFCPHVILPPGNRLMIYTFYPCPVSFCPCIHFAPLIILPPPIILPPWKSFNDLHYLPISCIILPLHSFFPVDHFSLLSFYPWKSFNHLHFLPMSHIILPPYHFSPWKFFNDLHYLPMSRTILPPALDPWGGAVVLK